MGSSSVSLDELDQQASASANSVSLDELDAQSPTLSKSQADAELTRNPLGPGSPGYKAKPAPTQSPKFTDVWFPNGVSTEAQAGAARAASPKAAAETAAGMPLADVAGKPHDPQLDVPNEYNPKTGMPFKPSLVPDLDAPGFVPGAAVPRLVERTASGLQDMGEAFTPQVNEKTGAYERTPAGDEAKKRQMYQGASDVISGAGGIGMQVAPIAVMNKPVSTIAAMGFGLAASEGAGAIAHRAGASPEAEELTRNVGFFLPSLMGVASGLKTGTAETPAGNFSGASAFGGKVRAGIARTPDVTSGRVKVGDTQFEVNIPRSRPAPVPEPSEAAKALASFEQHTGNPDFQPAPPPPAPPVPPGTNGPEHLTPDVVKGVSDAIMQADPAKRPGLMTEAHGNMVKWMVGRGTFVGPDSKIHTVDSEGQAKKLASKFINDEVDRRDAEAEKAAKAAEEAPKAQAAAVSTTAPIAGKPPAAGRMTTDTAAVKKVAAEANIHPEQQPAIAVKKEPPKETAALAQPPDPVKPEDVAKIGKEDKESGRTILQPSDDVMQNERLAAHAAPELATKLSHIAAGVEGATFDRLRPQKELERVDEKVDEAGKPPETVPDYLASQIAADSPKAKDQLVAAIKKNFNVIQVEDNFLEGKPELANYRSVNLQVQMQNGSTSEVQIVPREQQEIANESHVFYTAGRGAGLRGDKAEQEKQYGKAAEMHDAAMEKFNQRNGIEPKHPLVAREDKLAAEVKASKAAGNKHIDQLPYGVETMRGVHFKSLRDGSGGTITTVGSDDLVRYRGDDGKDGIVPREETAEWVIDGRREIKYDRNNERYVVTHAKGSEAAKIEKAEAQKAASKKKIRHEIGTYKGHTVQQYVDGTYGVENSDSERLVQDLEDQSAAVRFIDGQAQQPHSVPLDELEGLQAPTPKPDQATQRSYEDVQGDIDRREDALEKQGINPTRMYFSNNAEGLKGNPAWSPMPKDLEALYDERDKFGSKLLKQNTGDIAGRLQKAGLSDKEITRVMRDQYALKRGETTGADHYMATEHTQKAALRDPRIQAKEIYIKLANERGIFMDDEDDLWKDKKTTQDAIKATRAIYTYFGGEWPQKDNLLPEGRENIEPASIERRTNTAERKRLDQMTEAEKDRELTTAPKTGLPNSRAFDESGLEQSHPHVGFADVDDFKPFNTAFGHKGVDTTVLPAIGKMFRDAAAKEPAGEIHVYQQTSGSAGDEFLMRSKTPEAIKRVVDRVNKELAGTEFEYRKPDGTIVKKKGTGLSHGIGHDPESAEQASDLDKTARKAAGLRSGERDIPALDSRSTAGERTAVRDDTGRNEVSHSAPLEELEKSSPTSEVSKNPSRVGQLIDRFTNALSAGTLPTDPRALRAMAKEELGGDPSRYIDEIYDAIEGATNRYMRERRPGGTLGRRISYAETIEKQIGKRTRTLEITKLQQFSTPHTISEAAAYATGAVPDDTVLEPTAGTGNLVEPIRTDAVILTNELDPRRVEVLKANDYQHVTQQDYLKSNFKADVIVTNPPWGKISSGRYKALDVPAPWGRFNDVSERFMVKNLRDLPEGGRLVAVVPTTILQSGSAGFRKWIDQGHTLRAMVQSPPGAYVHRGTDVDSVLMVVDKGKIQGAEKPIIRIESSQPKDWAEYAEAVTPLADGGSHARIKGTSRETGEAAERAPLGDRTTAESESPATRTDSGRGLPELRGPGASPEPVRSERAGVGSSVVPEGDVSQSVDSPGADGASQPAATPRLVRQGSRALRPKDVSAARLKEFDEASDSPVFTPYVLRSGIAGNPHPRQIVETRSLAGASTPEIKYKPSKGVIDAHSRKVISDEQVDTVAAIGQAIENGHAYMVADDVGLGKSRELGATAIDWLEKGTAKRILVTSKGEVNLRDLESELKIVAGTDSLPFKYVYLRDYKEAAERAQSKNPYNPVPGADNAIYVVESFNLTPYRRAIQDLKIDGVLGDEVHTYKNEDAGVGQTWKVLHADWLQRKVPIAYFTATPGTTLDDLEYLYGLREWKLDGFGDWVARKTGHGTADAQKKRGEVKGQAQDISEQVGSDATDVSKSGRVTKAAQALASARLSGDRDLIAHFEAELKQAQKDEKNKKWGQNKGDSFRVTVSTAEMEQIMRELKMKGKYGARDLWRAGVEFGEKEAPLTKPEAEGYRRAVSYMREVEKAFNAFANENEAMRKGFGVTAFLQASAKRLLFDRRLTRAMTEAKESLTRGEQPVISLINVNETKEGEGYMAAALNQINVNKVIVDKESGEVTDLGEIPEAVAVKNELIERANEEFPPSPDPIAMIQKEFGKDKVAVITGNESPKVRRQMMEDFQKGIKKVAVISGAGKTGISLHHVTETTGGAKGRRHLILADYEWSATNFKQELGRVDRSGQASPPKITALTLGSAAEKKFISTIANRMKTLGAVSKGAAESTGTGALEHFELGGDIDNQVVREMWRTMPLNLREQFRGRHFMNYDQDGVARPKSSIENVGVRDFLLQLQLIPIEEGNKIWGHFWKQREETYSGDAVAAREAQKTGKTKGEILRSHELGPDLDLHEVKDAAGHRAGILSGMVTEHMGALQQHLDSGEEKTAEGMTVIRKRREYTTFTGSKGEQISGLRLRPGQIEPIAKAFGKGIAYEHTPETALQDVVAGDKVPLDNGWTLYMGKGGEKKGYVIIDGAKLSNTNRGQDVLRHGAKYNAVSGGFFYLPEDKAVVQGFLERFPVKKQAVESKNTSVAVKKPEPPATTGFEPGSMRASAFGLDILAKQAGGFYSQDVAPLLKGVAGGLKEVTQKGLRVIAPRVGVPSHLLDTIMRMKGQREEEMYRFQRTTEGMKKMFDKLPEEARLSFIDRMMHGQRQPSTELEDVADSIRTIQDRFRDQEKVFKPDLTDKENYFHLKWTKLPKGVDEDGNLIEGTGGERPNTGQGNRPLQGGRSFMKRKTLPDASSGIDRGGELLTTNPIGLLEHRVQESLKFTTARKMWEELKDTPYTVSDRGRPMHMVQFFREGQGQQARALGYEQLNDRIAKVLFPAGSGEGMVHPGEYWVEQNAARLLNNFLSRDLIRESAAGRGVVGLKNATTAWRLAFSPFHALVESIITTGSEVGRGIEHSFNQGLRQGSPAEAAKGIGIAAKAPVAPFTAAREGGSAIRYVTSPQEFLATTRGQNFISRYPEAAELVSDLFTGGAKLAMHEDFRMKMVESMRQAMADNNYIGAALRTPGALSQAIQYPLFEVYIPRLKLGMFLREYSEALADREPEIEAGKLTRAKLARETWDNIDYRFGEVNWDNFFFNRTFKTSLQLAFRAFAWRFGNFAFTGSGVTGQARQVAESLKFLKDAATGGESARPGTNAIPKIDPRMAKLLGLAIFGLIAHGMLQWALTREKPKDAKDLIAPRDGTLDSHGHPNRWTLPIVPYRDLESAKANPMGYLRGGTADIWTAIPEAINNRDFRNHLISHPSDPYWEQMFDKAAHVVGVPIGVDRYRQEKKRGEGTGNALLGEAGLSRATNYELTPAEKKMREIQVAHYGPETDEDLEAREKKDERIAAGRLTPKEMQDKVRSSMKNNFERGMKSFTYEQAKQVYDVANPEEKALMGMMLLRKRFNSRRTAAGGE